MSRDPEVEARVHRSITRVMQKLIKEHGFPHESVAIGAIRAGIDIALSDIDLLFTDVAELAAETCEQHLLDNSIGMTEGEMRQ